MPNYGKPLAGICAATALFLCTITGYPIPPPELPLADAPLSSPDGFVLDPGSEVEVTGDGFAPDAAVSISVYSTPLLLSEVVADVDGSISAVVKLPEDLALGSHTISAIGLAPSGEARALSLAVEVEPSALPFTGFDASLIVLSAIGLLFAGFVLIRSSVYGRPLLPERAER